MKVLLPFWTAMVTGLLSCTLLMPTVASAYTKCSQQPDTPLISAVDAGDIERAIKLAREGENINETGRECRTALHAAIGSINVKYKAETVRLLIENGADVNLPNIGGSTPLHLATRNGNLDVMRLLLEKGAKPDVIAKGDTTPLELAVQFGRLEAINLLLDSGADVDFHERFTLDKRLVRATISVIAEEGGLLRPNRPDDAYKPPLQDAIKAGQIEAARLLLRRGANVNIRSGQGNTALIWAIKLRSYSGRMDSCENELEILEMVKLLLERGAEIDVRNDYDETPLELASSRKCENVVKLLKNWKPNNVRLPN